MRSMLPVLVVSFLVAAAMGCGTKAADVLVEQPWARSSAGRTTTGVVYLRLTNQGSEPDKLLEIATPVAASAGVHETTREDGMMAMRSVPFLELPANELVALKPGGLHIMLMRLGSPLVEGTHFPMTLTFERAGEVSVRVEVLGAGAMGVAD